MDKTIVLKQLNNVTFFFKKKLNNVTFVMENNEICFFFLQFEN